MKLRPLALIIACLVGLGHVGDARGQDVDRIAAVVNEDVISLRDLEARVKMAITMSGLPDNLENRRRAVPQVLRKMVDEKLQMQEAARVKVTVPAEEVNRSIAGIERQNKMGPGGLMAQLIKQGIDPDAVRDQIRADIAWYKVTARVVAPNVKVGEEEISERLDLFRQQVGRPEYQLAEIFLAVDSPAQEEEARRLGERLQEQIKAGAPFGALARQFSQTPSAANGGVTGWVVDSNLDDEIRTVVNGMTKGQVSPMIRVANGFNIVTMLDKRISGAEFANDELVSISQIFFPTPPGSAALREPVKAKAHEMTSGIKGCADFEALGRKLGGDQSAKLENSRKSELPNNVRAAVADIALNKPTAPMDNGNGYLVYMVCSRSPLGRDAALPSREKIRQQIEDERLDLQGRRHLRDLRRAAFVDFRM